MPKRLTLADLDRMIWLANRRARAKALAARSGFPDQTGHIEENLMQAMRPHLSRILRLAREALYDIA